MSWLARAATVMCGRRAQHAALRSLAVSAGRIERPCAQALRQVDDEPGSSDFKFSATPEAEIG